MPHKGLIIEEVLVNFDANSLIKLKSIHIDDEDEAFFGLIIIEPGRTTGGVRTAKIVSIIDLAEFIKWPLASPKVFLVGTPKEEWIQQPSPGDQSLPKQCQTLPITASSSIRTFGTPSEWLNVQATGLKAIVLTMSKTQKLKDVFPPEDPNDAFQKPTVDKFPLLKEYLLQNQIDALILRDDQGNTNKCGQIDKLINNMKSDLMDPKGLKKYLTSPEKKEGQPPISLSRCHASEHAYHHKAFEPTKLSFCEETKCSNDRFNPTQSLHSLVDPISSNTTVNVQDEVCEQSNEDVDMTELSGENLSSAKQQEQLYKVALDDGNGGICSTSKKLAFDQADTSIALRKIEIQELKLTSGSGVVDDADLKETNYKKPESFKNAVDHITDNQADLFDLDELETYSQWFSLVPGEHGKDSYHYNCAICSTKLKEYAIKESNNLATSEGVLHRTKYKNMQELRRHVKTKGHRTAMQFYEDEKEAEMFQKLAGWNMGRETKVYRTTIRNLRTAFTIAKEDMAFHKHKGLVNLQTTNNLGMGTQCTSEWTSKRMIDTMGEMEHEDFIESLIASDSEFALICDGSTGSRYLFYGRLQ